MCVCTRPRVVLLILLGKLNDITWTLEQPNSSLMPLYWPFQRLLEVGPVFKVFFWMGWFGAPSAKPSNLWSNKQWCCALARSGKPDVSSEGLDIVCASMSPQAPCWLGGRP